MQELSASLREKVVDLHRALRGHGVPHAFGGAIALGFAAVPRSTLDIDLEIFVPIEDADNVLDAFWSLGLTYYPGQSRELIDTVGQVRLAWDGTAVDLFFSVHEFYDTVAARVATVADEPQTAIPVITAEDIVIFKTLFNRPKDWIDIESVLLVQGRAFDISYVTTWLTVFLGEQDSRIDRTRELHAGALDRGAEA